MFQGKIALVTGGAIGLGFQFVKELLCNGVEGVSLVDINAEAGEKSVKLLKDEFGSDRVVFFQADVSEEDQLKEIFKLSFKHWKALDILINNAGIVGEKNWEKTVSVNLMAPVRGTFLGFEYMSKRKGGKGGVIVNVASITGIENCFNAPTYSGCKSFLVSFSRSMSHDAYYQHNEVRVLAICPGFTVTSLCTPSRVNFLDDLCPDIDDRSKSFIKSFKWQSAEHVGKCLMDIIEKASNGSVWVIEGEELPYEVVEGSKSLLRKT